MVVRVTDPVTAQPYRLGVTLLAALQSRAGFEWRKDGAALTWLLGTPRVLDDLRQDKTVAQILDADRADHTAWRRARAAVLLY